MFSFNKDSLMINTKGAIDVFEYMFKSIEVLNKSNFNRNNYEKVHKIGQKFIRNIGKQT